MAVVQVLLAGMVILLVKYDPAGRNCLALPLLFLCLREHMLHCASFASPDNRQECLHAFMQMSISACIPLQCLLSIQPLFSAL